METKDQWSDSEGIEFFCRHLIALCITYKIIDEDDVQETNLRFSAYAGTLIRIEGAYYYLTSGHILREIEAALASDAVNIENTRLADTLGYRRISDNPIPIDLSSTPRFYVDDDELGLDYGLMAIHPHHIRLLAANNVVALEEVNWAHQSELTFDAYIMLGLPQEFTSEFVSESGAGTVSPTMFRVHKVDPNSEEHTKTHFPRFVGRIDPELELKSIKGMSGGPIFGFKIDKETRYWVVALQSSWNKRTRAVYGCLLPVLAEHIASLQSRVEDRTES